MKSCKGVLKDSFVRFFVIEGKRFTKLIKYENIEDLYKIDDNLLGVNAEKEIANKFAEYYCEMSNFNFKTHKNLKHSY